MRHVHHYTFYHACHAQEGESAVPVRQPCQPRNENHEGILIKRRGKGEKKIDKTGRLTSRRNGAGKCLQPLSTSRLITTRELPNTLVPSRQEHNRKQRQQERQGTRNVPLAEDDAEVL